MIGWINLSVEAFIRESFGDDVWAQLIVKARRAARCERSCGCSRRARLLMPARVAVAWAARGPQRSLPVSAPQGVAACCAARWGTHCARASARDGDTHQPAVACAWDAPRADASGGCCGAAQAHVEPSWLSTCPYPDSVTYECVPRPHRAHASTPNPATPRPFATHRCARGVVRAARPLLRTGSTSHAAQSRAIPRAYRRSGCRSNALLVAPRAASSSRALRCWASRPRWRWSCTASSSCNMCRRWCALHAGDTAPRCAKGRRACHRLPRRSAPRPGLGARRSCFAVLRCA